MFTARYDSRSKAESKKFIYKLIIVNTNNTVILHTLLCFYNVERLRENANLQCEKITRKC